MKLHFISSGTETAEIAKDVLSSRYGQTPWREADAIVALGGDGLMLNVMQSNKGRPIYGMHRGTIGFLMNDYNEDDLINRISVAELAETHPLSMTACTEDGHEHCALAINEVSLLRAGPQAAKLQISVNGRVRMEELICDGALVSTPAGSTAYNYSANGPILPIDANVLALTAIAAFRPRRWRGAILPMEAVVRFDVLEPAKRPVMANADSWAIEAVRWVEVRSEPSVQHQLLFDPGHGLEERLTREQFV